MVEKNSIRVAISSCLLGQKVRYDGDHKYDTIICEELGKVFELIPVCPEVAIGLGIPRPPIQLVDINNTVHALRIDDPSFDVSEPLSAYGKQIAAELDDISGYIFKARSPSCGINSTPIYVEGALSRTGAGLFAEQIIKIHPELPVAEETALHTRAQRNVFQQKIIHYHQLKLARLGI